MINNRLIDQAYSDLHDICGGVKQDYFGLLYLEQEHKVPREKAVNQVAFGGNDYGIDVGGGGDVVYYFTIINPPCPLEISHPSSPFNCSGA